MSGLGCEARFIRPMAGLAIGLGLAMGGCAPIDTEHEDPADGIADLAPGDDAIQPLADVRRVDLVAPLLPANELPPIPASDPEGSGTGSGTLRIQLKKNGPGPSSATVGLIFSLCGLPGTSVTVTRVDVREGAAGQSSPTPHILGTIDQANPVTYALTNGCLKEGVGGVVPPGESLAAAAQEVIANPGNFYFEVCTAAHPDGWARGQLDYMTF